MKSLFRKLSVLLLTALLCVYTVSFAEEIAAPETEGEMSAATLELSNAQMAFLYEESTDTILFEMNADETNAPASMTKVMTAVLVLEYDPELAGTMIVPDEAVSPQYCSWMDTVHLMAGEQITVRELMKYLLIASGNEAATTLAVYVCGDIPTFVEKMNEKAAELGMTQTHYEDPHGLSSESYISARDMLTLSRYAMQIEQFREIVCLKSGELVASGARSEPIRYTTTNRVMNPRGNPAYESELSGDVIGIKTGSTGAAGYNLSACMVHGDLTFYSVVMHCAPTISGTDLVYGHYTETIKLLSYGRSFEKMGYAEGDTVTTAYLWGRFFSENLALTAANDLFILSPKGKTLTPEITLERPTSQVKKGDVVGRVTIKDSFGNVHETALIAAEDAAINLTPLFGAALVIAITAALFVLVRKRKRTS